MSVWHYGDVAREPEYVWSKACTFCTTPLMAIHEETFDGSGDDVPFNMAIVSHRTVKICQACGWWTATDFQKHPAEVDSGTQQFSSGGACASIIELDLNDIETPMQQVRDYLTADFDRRLTMHPTLFEQTVSSVFGAWGYENVVTGQTKDGGIDVLMHSGKGYIGVQVKKTVNAIEVEQIRSLAGSLVRYSMDRGFFVTTSRFTRGGPKHAADFCAVGHSIELIDAEKFYYMLKEAQGTVSRSVDDLDVRRCLSFIKPFNTEKLAISFG